MCLFWDPAFRRAADVSACSACHACSNISECTENRKFPGILVKQWDFVWWMNKIYFKNVHIDGAKANPASLNMQMGLLFCICYDMYNVITLKNTGTQTRTNNETGVQTALPYHYHFIFYFLYRHYLWFNCKIFILNKFIIKERIGIRMHYTIREL